MTLGAISQVAYYASSTNTVSGSSVLKIFASSAASTAIFDMTGNNVIGLADASISSHAVNLGQVANLANGNAIINGNFDFWQRWLSSASAGGFIQSPAPYVADRWRIMKFGSIGSQTVARDTTTVKNASYSFKFTIVGQSGTAIIGIEQPIELYGSYSGSSVTLTAWVFSGGATSICIADSIGSSTSTAHPGDSAWHQLTVTRFLASTITSLSARLGCENVSGADAGNSRYFDGAMMVLGNAPVNYVPRSMGEELALCERYYEKDYPPDTPPGTDLGGSATTGITGTQIGATTAIYGGVQFKATKRVAPTVSIYADDGSSTTQWVCENTAGSGTKRTLTQFSTTISNVVFQQTAALDLFCYGHWVASAEM